MLPRSGVAKPFAARMNCKRIRAVLPLRTDCVCMIEHRSLRTHPPTNPREMARMSMRTHTADPRIRMHITHVHARGYGYAVSNVYTCSLSTSAPPPPPIFDSGLFTLHAMTPSTLPHKLLLLLFL
jgi:hypothetical protein